MIATIAACVFAGTTIYCLGGWCVEAYHRKNAQRQVDAYLENDWHSAEEMTEFAGRCAWIAVSTGMMVPSCVDDHLRENFIAGWREEEAQALAETAMWNASPVLDAIGGGA